MTILTLSTTINMRRILIISLATLVLVIGVAGAAPATYAAIGSACSEENDSACDPATSYCELIQNSPQYNTCVPNSQMAADAATAQTSVTAASSGQNNPINDLTNSDSGYNTVMLKIMGLFAWLLGVAIVTLDYTVYYTVVKMGSYVNSLSAIGVAWRILRDFANIMLIFGFLGAGIATILNIDLYGWSTKMLPKLLIAAVLINFSLFVSEAMIDGTNLLATQFYTQINGGKLPTGNFPSYTAIEGTQSSGISGKIMAQLGMQQIYGKAVNNQDVFKGSAPWYLGFMGILLFITAAFVMFSLAFILIARFVALIFLILVSPVAFMGWAVPWLEYR
ncbi:MAG: hypothetical protein Q8O94_01340, partial [bacterium]|nr:hypothetical protein [bacterium]